MTCPYRGLRLSAGNHVDVHHVGRFSDSLEEAAGALRDALDLWRGDPFADAPASTLGGPPRWTGSTRCGWPPRKICGTPRLRLGDHAGAVGEIDS